MMVYVRLWKIIEEAVVCEPSGSSMARIGIIDSLCVCISGGAVPLIFRICLKRFWRVWWIFLMIEGCTLLLFAHRVRLIWEMLAVSWLHVWLWTHSPSTCPALGILRFGRCLTIIWHHCLIYISCLSVLPHIIISNFSCMPRIDGP